MYWIIGIIAGIMELLERKDGIPILLTIIGIILVIFLIGVAG